MIREQHGSHAAGLQLTGEGIALLQKADLAGIRLFKGRSTAEFRIPSEIVGLQSGLSLLEGGDQLAETHGSGLLRPDRRRGRHHQHISVHHHW